MIKENILKINNEIKEILQRKSSYDPVKIIAVTKMVNNADVKEAIKAGINSIGENQVKPLLERINFFKNSNIEYNFIGNLQTNKVKYIVDKVDLIHSLDRISLLNELEKRSNGKEINTLIQLNISKESSKLGIYEENLNEFIKQIECKKFVKVKGLMTIAPYFNNLEDTRDIFKKMKYIFDELKVKKYKNIEMKYLSMGMTNDYRVAVEEGANIIRLGRAIFGQRNY